MKYLMKFANRRELADWERLLDKYDWFILKDIGTTVPPGFVENATSGSPTRNSYSSLSDITDEVLATTDYSVRIYKGGSNYYRRIPNHMLWRVISFKKDDCTVISRGNDKWGEEKGIVGYYSPMSIQEEGDFSFQDFNNDFLVPIMLGEWHWTSLGTTAPTGYTFTEGQDTCSNISEVTPAVQDDFPYMKVGNIYYRKDMGSL